MSGFEIAGIVLGGLPLLIEGVKAARFYFQGLERWWEFRKDFEAFVRAIEFEEVIFGQNLDILLTPLGFPDHQYRSLRYSHRSNLWSHPDIVDKLRLHLGEALPLITRMLMELNKDLTELYKLLPVKDGKACFPTSRTINSEKQRLYISFSQNTQPLLDKIHTTNDGIGQILRNAKAIEMARASATSHSRVSSTSTYANSFIKLQNQSRTFYGALKSRFSCSCNTQHRCGISAQWDKSKLDSRGPSLNLLFDDRQGRKQVRWDIEAVDRAELLMPRNDQHSLDQIYELNRQANLFRQRNEYQQAAQDRAPAALVLSSFAMVNTPSNNLQNTQTEDTQADWAASLERPIKRFKSAIKGASSTFSRQNQTIQAQTTQTQLVQPRVQIASLAARPAPRAKSSIADICSFIRAPPATDRCLGTIEADHHDINLYLEPQFQRPLVRAQNETMETFWRSTTDLSARLRVGLSVAVTLLTLGTSAWIPRCWGRKDVFLMRCSQAGGGQTSIFGPYLDHSSLSFTLKEEPMSADDHAVLAMFSLGVLLLELHYRTPLESSPYWDKHCPNGLRNEYTDMAAAWEWYEDLARDPALEEGLAEPVRRCIEASFSTAADMEDMGFLRDVLETVVEPLEVFIDQWSGG